MSYTPNSDSRLMELVNVSFTLYDSIKYLKNILDFQIYLSCLQSIMIYDLSYSVHHLLFTFLSTGNKEVTNNVVVYILS